MIKLCENQKYNLMILGFHLYMDIIKWRIEVIEVSEYICKIATIEEMEQNWNYLIEIHPNNNAWKIYKEEAIKNI